MRTDLDDLEARVATNESELDDAFTSIGSNSADIGSLTGDLNALIARHDSDIAALNQEIDDCKSRVMDLETGLSDLADELDVQVGLLNTAISDNSGDISALSTTVSILSGTVSSINASITTINSRISSLEISSAAHGQDITDILARLATAEAAIANHEHAEIDLTGVEDTFTSEGRDVYIFKTPTAAVLANYVDFCSDRGLDWWSPKSSADAQGLLDFARAIDNYHTWIQVYGVVTTHGNPATINGYAIAPDSPQCMNGSSSGWAGVRDWGCSMCDPDGASSHGNTGRSYCWDTSHQYDWFVCE